MKKSWILIIALTTLILACSQQESESQEADMYEASELSLLMREMVEYSEAIKDSLQNGNPLDTSALDFSQLLVAQATRDEQKDPEYQAMARTYLHAIEGIRSGDSLNYYYQNSINACKSCHGVYCSGPMAAIKNLDLNAE